MSQRKHLNAQELLLSCDGELPRNLSAHLSACEECAQRLRAMTADLLEIEEALRSSVHVNGAAPHAAAWARLEREIRPSVVVFPARRWAPAIGLAASLLLAAVWGNQYLNRTVDTVPAADTTFAVGAVPDVLSPGVGVETAAVDLTLEPAALPVDAARELVGSEAAARAALARVTEPTVETPAETSAEASAVNANPESAQPVERYEIVAASYEMPLTAELASLAGRAPEVQMAAVTRNAWTGLPAIRPPSETERALPPAELSATQVADLVAAYQALTKAGLWQEDVRPVWTPAGLWISGTVENAEGRERLAAAVLRAGLADASFDVKIRADQARAARPRASAGPDVLDPRPLGGVVRTALMSHFGDAARRSFLSPRPEALQSELDRYVTEVFKSEADLLAHVYALHSLVDNVKLDSIDPNAAGDETVRTFDELVRFHASAIREAEARIYDKLSEALPRRFWSYRSAESEALEGAGRADQVRELLTDSLQLDNRLTALLGAQEMSIDAREANLSCGELLYRIRARVRHLR